jgi:single-strand DNA-binding protein
MAALNKVLLIGNCTRDPEKRTTPSGLVVVELGVAVNRRYKASTGEEREEVCFVDVTVWGKSGELCAEYLRKGSQVFIEGRLKLDTWEKDGQKRSKMGVVAENVQFLDRPRRDAEFGGAPSDAAPARPSSRPAQASTRKPASADDVPPGGPDDDIPF